MKNIISFSLYGNKSMYWKGALANIELAKEIYPDYICRFYIDQNASQELKDSIVGVNVEKFFMKNRGGIDGMFWRFLPAAEKDVNIFLCRDVDSRLSFREKAAVDEWLCSDKDFHIMRDHPHHIEPIMGGMWGCRKQLLAINKFGDDINSWHRRQHYGDDQLFLKTVVYRKFKYFAFEHSTYTRHSNLVHPFPDGENKIEYVGKIYDNTV